MATQPTTLEAGQTVRYRPLKRDGQGQLVRAKTMTRTGMFRSFVDEAWVNVWDESKGCVSVPLDDLKAVDSDG